MKNFLTLDDFDFKNKTVLVRVDINVPYDIKKKKVEMSDRLVEAAETIKELSNKKAKVAILAHQGRKGDDDFISLKQHAKLLTKIIKKKVEYVDDIVGKKTITKIKSLKSGQIILLDNVRFLKDEAVNKPPKEHAKSQLVKTLSPLADIFVNDAFSASHRSHASIVGFAKILPVVAGRTMERELITLRKIFVKMKISKHDTFVLGGAKPEDPLDIIEHMLEIKTLEKVLTGGIVGQLFLMVRGYDLGEATKNYMKEEGYLSYLRQAKRIWSKYKNRIETPVDLAIDVNGKRKEISIEELPTKYQILDIGKKTVENYSKIIKQSKTIVFKGPMGVYENDKFGIGTKLILKAITNSEGFSLVGGGHTLSAIEKFKISKKRFSHVSLGGGALITYLSGKKLPGVEVLRSR